jgi:3-hydroxyacyl-CoA dehydrogenase/enoyl-CoA hydratase/3-hydroxybutyryl-CoA epimerase
MMDNAVHISTDADRVMTIVLDVPGKPVNTCTPQLLADLAAALDEVGRVKPVGVIIASAKARSFNAGADLFAIRDMTDAQVAEYIGEGQALFERVARLPMPTVAAINGDCLGGGCELALACTYRVAANDPAISIGLPEVKLGLIPAWGGSTRLPRIIGLTKALPILLAGKTMPPRKALKAGLVDEVVRPEALLDAARRLVTKHAKRHSPRMLERVAARLTPARNRILAAARGQAEAKTFGNYPAAGKVLGVVEAGYAGGVDAGLAAEREAILALTKTPACRNLLRVFFLRQGAKRRAAERLTAKPREVTHAAVIGGGTMGAGIVHALIRAGVKVRLVEVSAAAMSAALGRVRKMLDDDVAMGKLDKLGARDAFYRVSPTLDWTGLGLADVVVEAVVETMEPKRDVFARLDQLCRPDAVLATNTSSLLVDEMARSTLHPNRVLGLHFFNPVNKMPLVEIVRASQSDDASLATAVALVNRLGKTPVVVKDAPGFLVNRLLIPHLAEALAMAAEGVPIATIDEAVKRWGMPMGPFELLDEIGLDIALHVLRSISHVLNEPVAVPAAVERAVAAGHLGKKTGKGFYVHAKVKRGEAPKLEVNPELVLAPPAVTVPLVDEIQWRLILPMVNEAARVLAEGITDSADDIDLATVMGLGFAPFRGGLAKFADDTRMPEVVRRLDELMANHGPRFAPAPMLRQMSQFPRPQVMAGRAAPQAVTPVLQHVT